MPGRPLNAGGLPADPTFQVVVDSQRECGMAFRTNYSFERVERDRAKKAKKEEKLKKRQERGTESPASDAPVGSVEHARPDE